MKRLKRIIIVLIILLGLTFKTSSYTIINYKENKKENTDINMQEIPNINVNLSIYKQGIDDNFLSGVNFKLKSYNNVFQWNLIEDAEKEIYSVNESNEISASNFLKVLSSTQKELIDSIKTTDDIETRVKDYDYNEKTDVNGISHKLYYIYLPTVFTIEETYTPNGYLKEKFFLKGEIELVYELSQDNNVELIDGFIRNENYYRYLKYDDYNEEELVGIDFEKSINLWDNQAIESSKCYPVTELPFCPECGTAVVQQALVQQEMLKKYNSTNHQEETEPITNICFLSLKNTKGKISLSVENKVNETTSLTTTNNTNLTYKVILKNTGNVDAIDNTLTSKIPEGFEYIEGSASDGGIYKDGEIIWNVKRLEQGKDKTFTFRVHVPKGTDLSKSYIGESSVTNLSMQNRVESEKTVVKLSLINPNTLAPITIISVVLISLILLIVQALKYNKNKLHTKI